MMRFLGRSAAVIAAVSLAGGVAAACPGVASATPANQAWAGTSAGATDPLGIGPIVERAKLTAADGVTFGGFGGSVAASGDTLVVGAPGATVADTVNQGAVYVLRHSPSGWAQEAKLTASDGAAFDQLGFSVAASGDTVVAGAPNATVGGAAYVFTSHGSRWSQDAKLTDEADDSGQLGWSVGISGNKVVAGAPSTTIDGNLREGDAYVFAQHGGSWYQEAKLTAPDGNQNDEFGQSVAISGGTVAAGAPVATIGENPNQGAAYVFAAANASWTERAKLTAADGAAFDQFGAPLTISRHTLVVDAPFATLGGNSYQGAAYVSRGAGRAGPSRPS
jgi:hypothetical protein